MGNQPGLEGLGERFEEEASKANPIRPQIRPYNAEDKNAEFPGYGNNVPDDLNQGANANGDRFNIDPNNFDPSALIHITNMNIADAEAKFTQQELQSIRKEFDLNSKDEIIGKRKLIELFRIMEISDTYLANQFFAVIKNSHRLNQPIDYQKFITFVSIISKGNTTDKLLLLFSIFGKGIPDRIDKKKDNSLEQSSAAVNDESESQVNQSYKNGSREYQDSTESDEEPDEQEYYDPRISREDIKLHISGTILSMVNIQFEDVGIEALKQQLCRQEEQLIDDALELLVEEIFDKYALSNKDDGLTFHEWSQWFQSLDGIQEMLMTPAQRSHQKTLQSIQSQLKLQQDQESRSQKY